MHISWDSEESHVFLNPTYSLEEQKKFKTLLEASPVKGHIWLSTSGSTVAKWVGLSKEAILALSLIHI